MADLDKIAFIKFDIAKLSDNDRKDLTKELKKRNISFRLTPSCIYVDERYRQQMNDIIPKSY